MPRGLQIVGTTTSRELRQEFITYTDPYIEDAMQQILSVAELNELEGFSRSYYTKEGHMSSIRHYDRPIRSAPSNSAWKDTVAEARYYFEQLPKVQAMSAHKRHANLKKVKYHEGTSAGFGYYDSTSHFPTHKGPKNGANHKRAIRIAAKAIGDSLDAYNAGNWNNYLDKLPLQSTPDVAFTRTQLTELPKLKIRNVFGEAFHYVLLEGLFAQPLIETFMMIDSFYYIGKEPLQGVPYLIDSMPEEITQFISLDWKSFDATVQPYEIRLAFDLLEIMLVFPDIETRLTFEYVRKLFIERKLAAPDGTLFLRKLGIPSGSYFTHIIGSIVNYNRIQYLFKRLHNSIRVIKTHGDDSIIAPSLPVTRLTDIIDLALENDWLISEKSALYGSRYDVEFLGRRSTAGVSTRDTWKCLRLLLYPEYPVTNPQISIARLKGINIDTNGKLPYISEIYHYLNVRYTDEEWDLPLKFRRFNLTELHTVLESI